MSEQANPRNTSQPSRKSKFLANIASWKEKTYDTLNYAGVRPKEIFLPVSGKLKYEPLSQSPSIRLLSIQPGKPWEVISCSLVTVALSENPRYEALSYTWEKDSHLIYRVYPMLEKRWNQAFWGLHTILDRIDKAASMLDWSQGKPQEQRFAEPGSRRKIICNDQPIYIGANLYEALRELRQIDTDERYWIDAICINQQDTAERSLQVQCMDQIYRQAYKVVVWLGTCIVDTRDESAEDRTYYCLYKRWFTRLWVVQEFCFAKDVVFMLGKDRVTTDTLLAGIRKSKGLQLMSDHDAMVLKRIFESVFKYSVYERLPHVESLIASRQFISQGGRFPIEEWLQLSRDRQAKDPRDMIFGAYHWYNLKLL